MAVLKKSMGPTKKKIIFKNKIKTDIPNKKIFGKIHEFCFTNMKTILQKYVSNKYFLNYTLNKTKVAELSPSNENCGDLIN